jgi:hypothetical protein
VEGDERTPMIVRSAAGKDAVDWTTRRASFISLAETVTRSTSRRSSAGVFNLIDFTGVPLDSCFRWSPTESAESLDDNTTSAAPTAPSSAPRDVAAASPGTSTHASIASNTAALTAEDVFVPEKEAPISCHASLALSKAAELQALRDKLQAVQLITRRALLAARAPPPHITEEPAPPTRPERRTPIAMSDAEISEGPARLWYEPSIRAWCPVQRDEPNKLRIAMATSPGKPMPLKAAHTPLPIEMQVPCLMLPPVVPATLPYLFCRQAGRHGWAEAPVRSRVQGMDEDNSDAVRDRRALAPRLTPLDARQQCPALFRTVCEEVL